MKDVNSSNTQKSTAEVTGREFCTDCVEHLQEEIIHDSGGKFCLYYKKLHKTGDKKIFEEYKMEATIQSKIRLDKCDAYTAKETLGYWGRKSFMSAARGAAKSERERRRNKPTDKLIGAPNKRIDEPMKNQNTENEEKDSDTHRQETEEARGREKVGEGAIRKRKKQEEIATKPKIAEDKDTKEKVEQRNRTKDRNIKIGNTGG